MRKLLLRLTGIFPQGKILNLSLLLFRVLVSVELMIVHGLKKIGVGTNTVEMVPNPLHLPQGLNEAFATAANLLFPLFVIAGFLTRLAVLPILSVTLIGYFILHRTDPLLIKDTPFMYSVVYLFILFVGPGKYSMDYYLFKKTSL